nr:hypothetical protein [Rhizobiaceae bacterium]
HVIRAAHALRGIRARRITGALCGLVTFDGRGLVANLGPKPEMLADALPEGLAMQGMRLLSAASFAESSSPRWLDQAASDGAVGTVLPPFATAFFGDFT